VTKDDLLNVVEQISGSRGFTQSRCPKEDRLVKSISKSIFVCLCMFALVSFAAAQTPTGVRVFTQINPPPCDFSDQFYQDNGLDLATGSELNAEPDGRFGTFRKTGPPAIGSQVNWVTDSTCATNDPTRRNFRILATTGGNKDEGNSPFTNNTQETPEFISILAFLHNGNVFIGSPNAITQNYTRTVGKINGGLDGVQQNDGNIISITQGTDLGFGTTQGINPRGISLRYLVGSFPAFAGPRQMINGQFATGPCSDFMENNGTGGAITTAPTPCFPVKDAIVNGKTVSNAATPNLRQDWRFTTNRSAIDGSDPSVAVGAATLGFNLGSPEVPTDINCIDIDPSDVNDLASCQNVIGPRDSPFGYFCDDLLGIWLVHYFWFTTPPNTDANCTPIEKSIGNKNGFSLDGTPIILTEFELDTLEATFTAANPALTCAAESGESGTGADGGAVWLVCPAIPDPRNGGIAKDAFLDVVRLPNGNAQDPVVLNAFSCLQNTGKFCNEAAPGQ
jgi:hypothetical protein